MDINSIKGQAGLELVTFRVLVKKKVNSKKWILRFSPLENWGRIIRILGKG